MVSTAGKSRVVIVGAGFGGLWVARSLAHSSFELLLIDRHNYHCFLPLLYQVAAAELEPEDIVYPVRSILRKYHNAQFCLAEVHSIDFERRSLATDGPSVPYDYLVIATGSVAHVFGIPGVAEHAFFLKTLEQGIRLRNHILSCFERAAREPDAEQRRRLLTFMIVGGGPTGVEFAGALAELMRGPLVKDFPLLDLREARVMVVEAADTMLQGLPARHRTYALQRLTAMGADVRLRAGVVRVDDHAADLKTGETIATDTVVWTAGVRGEPLAERTGLPVDRAGRVAVLPTLQIPDHPEVYVIGDLARVQADGPALPMTAPVAIQQGSAVGRNIRRQLAGLPPVEFRYRDRGMMATIGRDAAVACIAGVPLTGFPAWLVWLSVHLANLIGFRNRLLVLINWAWDYFLFEKVVRLILPGGEGQRNMTNGT